MTLFIASNTLFEKNPDPPVLHFTPVVEAAEGAKFANTSGVSSKPMTGSKGVAG